MRKIQQGFTLIELMIVVAIIGILAAIAIPQYQDYVIRSRLSKVAAAVNPLKNAVAEYAQFNGRFDNFTGAVNIAAAAGWTDPQTSGGLGVGAPPTPTTEIANYTLTAGGRLEVLLRGIGNGVDGTRIRWTPAATPGSNVMTWTIDNDTWNASSTGNAKTGWNEIQKWR